MSQYAKILSLIYNSAVASKTSALKSYYRSVRLIKDAGTINPGKDSKYTNVLLCGNCIDPENRNLYVFYIDTFYQASWIIEINIDSREQKVVYYDKDNNIGFDPLHKIYNARVVHGRIIWTDNLNPIYQIDIERAKRSWLHKIGYGQYPTTVEWSEIVTYGIDQIVSAGNNFYKSLIHSNLNVDPRAGDETIWKKLCLIEDAYYSMDVKNFYFEPVPPKHPPIVTYETNDTRKINNLRQTLFQVAYRYVYMDWRKSTFSPASIVPVPQAEEETATGLSNEQVSINNLLRISVNTGGEEVRAIEVIARSSDDPSKWYLIETINKFTEEERGNEFSKTVEPPYISMVITLPAPTVKSSSVITIANVDIGLTIPLPLVYNSALPSVPLAYAGSQLTQTSFSANWYNTTNATGFYLDVATDIAFTSFVPGYQNKDVGNSLAHAVVGLTANTTYYYRLRAYNYIGDISASSNIITVATLAVAITTTPVATAASAITATTCTVNWNHSLSANAYYIDVALDIDFTNFEYPYDWQDKLADFANNYPVTGLTPNTTYYFRVRALFDNGTSYLELSPNSNVITFTTLP